MSEGPLTLRCPWGEEWPGLSFKSLVALKEDIQTHDTITWLCPAGHSFTLKKAVKTGMFTPEQALTMIAEAQRRLPEARKEAKRLMREFRRPTRKTK
ncbi:hypothetical protein LCGC14_2662070 [marine sediment metagenome]|uniref:Uncharacterized protein n=1 Tax=marine sediment metagenome TaxID=412755 RepID=A0A0F9AE09_9ZZZZ